MMTTSDGGDKRGMKKYIQLFITSIRRFVLTACQTDLSQNHRRPTGLIQTETALPALVGAEFMRYAYLE